jgi:hydrogenase maturation protein HypF
VIRVQHHAAHASALAAEHPDVDDWLVFTWDGVGYGSDGTLWGGEALAGRAGNWRRRGSFRPFRLVGGDKAGREPWRSAAALLWAEGIDAEERLNREALNLAHQAWKKGTNTFDTSAAGRLFDAAAALVLGRQAASFEGQGPMELEHAAQYGREAVELPLAADADGVWRSDWAPLLPVLADEALEVGARAGIFHESLARVILEQALRIRSQTRFEAVGTERVAALLGEAGLDVRLHEEIPANDGGLCLGQAIEAAAVMEL